MDSRREREPPRTQEDVWERLGELLDRIAQGGLGRLSDREVEDLGRFYRAAATHLALHRGLGASAGKLERLNDLVSRAHTTFYGRSRKRPHRRTWLRVFLLFPLTVRRTWQFHAAALMLLLLGGIYGFLGAAADPDWALEFTSGADDRTPYASREELLESLHHGRDGQMNTGFKTAFAAGLWVNNTRVAVLAFFLGVLGGLPTVWLILMNGVMLGCYSYTFHSHGLAYEWWAWILPHGITELLAIVLLAGGGLWIGRLMIAPGEQSRLDAFRAARAGMSYLLLFSFPMLLMAALIESFVRQSQLGDGSRYVFALVTLALWGLYLGLTRPPAGFLRRVLAERTVSERSVPLPEDEDMLRLARGVR